MKRVVVGIVMIGLLFGCSTAIDPNPQGSEPERSVESSDKEVSLVPQAYVFEPLEVPELADVLTKPRAERNIDIAHYIQLMRQRIEENLSILSDNRYTESSKDPLRLENRQLTVVLEQYSAYTSVLHDYQGLRNAAQAWYENDPKMDKYFTDAFLNAPNQGDFPWFLRNESFVFVPENPDNGVYLPYVLVLPQEYNAERLNYLLLTPNGTGERHEYHHNLGAFMRSQGWQGSAMATLASNLNMIRIHPIVGWQCMWNVHYKDAVYPSIMDLTSVLADSSNQSSFKRCTSSVETPGDPARPPHTDVTAEEFARIVDVEQQLKLIIEDAVALLNHYGYNVSDQVMGYGYSQSAGLITRLATVYPTLFKAYFAGGTMKHILPDPTLPYPYGVKDHEKLFGESFDALAYQNIAKLSNFGSNDFHFPILDRGHNYNIFISLYGDVLSENNVKTASDVYTEIAQRYLSFDVGGMFYLNTQAGHYVTPSDLAFIEHFYRINMESETPVYIEQSIHDSHQIISRIGG